MDENEIEDNAPDIDPDVTPSQETEADNNPIDTPSNPETGSPDTPDLPEIPEDSNSSTEDDKKTIPVNLIKYYVKISKKKVISEETRKQYRIDYYAKAKDEGQEDPIEIPPMEEENPVISYASFESKDEEIDIFISHDKDTWREESELPENISENIIKFTSATETEYEYIPVTDKEGNETYDEIEVGYEIEITYYFSFYEGEKEAPDSKNCGFCVRCKHVHFMSFPFPHFVCDAHKRTNYVVGMDRYLPCKDFNRFGECLLYEEDMDEIVEDEILEDITDGDGVIEGDGTEGFDPSDEIIDDGNNTDNTENESNDSDNDSNNETNNTRSING